jgi:hypothetical protein
MERSVLLDDIRHRCFEFWCGLQKLEQSRMDQIFGPKA